MTGSNIFGSRLTDRQTFTGSMFVTGSGTFSSTITTNGGIIGNNSNHLYLSSNSAAGEISFWANQLNTRLMTLSGSGNLGIGTSTPSSKLEVNVGLNSLKISGRDTYIDSTEDATNANIYVTQAGVGDFSQLAGNLVLQARTQGTVYRDIIFAGGLTNGDALMTILGEGNVGIGTSTPSQKLEVVGGEIKAGRVDTGNEGGQLSFGRALDNNTSWYIDTYGSAASPQLRFVNVDNAVVAMTITGSSVGIGTDSNIFGKLSVEAPGNHITMRAPAATAGKYWALDVSSANQFYVINNAGTQYFTMTDGGNFGIGAPSPSARLHVANSAAGVVGFFQSTATNGEASVALEGRNSSGTTRSAIFKYDNEDVFRLGTSSNIGLRFETNDVVRTTITSGGSVLFQKSAANNTDTGAGWFVNDYFCVTNNSADSGDRVVLINRQNSDGTLIDFRHANVTEGSISVAGSTVSYNGGHLSRYSQTELNEKIEGLLKGTIMSNLDKMAVWINPETEEPYENEQLNCMKISDVEGDKNVAGVFVNWQYDSELLTNDMNIAMTGDMIIRIAQGVVVEKGQLLMSAGDGTAKPQEDDIIRSKTIAKVTSNHITCVYEDGSYCVPCVLMAC